MGIVGVTAAAGVRVVAAMAAAKVMVGDGSMAGAAGDFEVVGVAEVVSSVARVGLATVVVEPAA